MSRRSRWEKRLLKEQDTLAMRRDERKEQEELVGKKKFETTLTKIKDEERDIPAHTPRRVARVGKPLKR